MQVRLNSRSAKLQRKALVVAVGLVFTGMAGVAFGQATTGTIFGQAPVANGETVQITGGAGFNRTIPVDDSGRYTVTIPVGTYTVTLMKDGQAIQTKNGVTTRVAGSVQVDFTNEAGTVAGSESAKNLSTVTVTANGIPSIDVSSVNESTIITAEQLKHLPLARSGEAIALLSPGSVQGAALLGTGPTGEPLVSFGGASVAENAYYINGFNTSDPLGNSGGITLPYGAIAQQQTLTSGYGAQYGRSAGGVISQVGQSGSNTWHFGGQVLWSPAFARSQYDNIDYVNPRSQIPGEEKGDLYRYRNGDSLWNTVYDAYIGGPLIKDKLFFYAAAEADKTQTTDVGSIGAANVSYQRVSDPKYYLKLDWNINDSNTLSLTGVQNTNNNNPAEIYDYDYTTKKSGQFSSLGQETNNKFKIWIAKYTSYITDNLSLNAMYGKMDGTYYSNQPAYPGFDPSLPNIITPDQQNPLYSGGGGGITNSNTNISLANPAHKSEVINMRLDLDWKLGDHDIQFGIDNDTTRDINAGDLMTGPGYAWEYQQAAHPDAPIAGTPGAPEYVAAPGGEGYYVDKYVFQTQASVKVTQRAQYVQDNWQITPRFLLNLGLRNDQFTNYNPGGVAFLRLTSPQWAPRVGFSWDVNGDSSLKIFGNAGRYYLAMPAGVALRDAGAPLFTREYFTYTGIDANGIPQGLTPITSNPSGPVPINGENGVPLDPKVVAAKNLKAEYQDEYVLGMQQQITPEWNYGVTALVRRLGRVIDDVGDVSTICNVLVAQGGDPASCANIDGSILINPGSVNTIRARNAAGGYDTAVVTPQDFGFPPVKRKYYSLETFLEHSWDGKWYGKVDYVFSRSYGNTEGPVQSNIGQGGNSVSATEAWDYGSLMQNSNGLQANDRKHVIKAYGTYQVAPEWTVGGVLTIASGTPKSCLGYLGPDETDPINYGPSYHWCGGVPAVPGTTGRTPWIHQLDLQAEYRPQWADKKLGFQIQLHNALNEQKVTQIYPFYGSVDAPLARYGQAEALEIPRYVQLGVTYDW